MNNNSSKNIIQFRQDIVKSAKKYGISETARIFNTTRPTVTKWMKRFEKEGLEGLKNLSKKDYAYPNRMPDEIAEKIVQLKTKEPQLSATAIKRKLNLNYDLKIIIKKIRDAGLIKDKNMLDIDFKCIPKKVKSLEYIFITIRKINDFGNQNLPAYYLLAYDYKTGMTFLSYTYENIELTISIFLDYLLENFKRLNIKTEKVSFIPLKKSIINHLNKENSLLKSILNKFNSRYYVLSDINIKKSKNILTKIGLESDFLRINNFYNVDDLLSKSYTFLLDRNYNLSTKIKIPKNHNNIFFLVPPVITGEFISRMSDLKKDSMILKYQAYEDDITDKTIFHIQALSYEYKMEYEINKSLSSIEKILLLINDRPEYNQLKIEITLNKGKAYEYMGKFKDAGKIYKSALAFTKETKNTKQLIRCYTHLAFYHALTGNITSSLKSIKLAHEYAILSKKNMEILNITQHLAEIKLNNEENKSALKNYYIAYELAQKLDYKKWIAKTCIGISAASIKLGDHEKGNEFILKAIELADQINDQNIIMIAYSKYADLYVKINEFPFKYYKQFLEFASTSNDKNIIMDSYEKIGNINMRMEHFEEAMKFYKRGLLLAEETQHTFKLCTFLLNIGNIYWFKQKFTKALGNFQKCLKSAEENELNREKTLCYLNIGRVYNKLQKLDKALHYLQKSLAQAKKNGTQKIIAASLLNLSSLFLQQENYNEVLNHAKKQLQISKELRDQDHISRAYSNIAEAYYFQKKQKLALKYSTQAVTIAEEYNIQFYICNFLYIQGLIYNDMNNSNEAKIKFDKAEIYAARFKKSDLLTKIRKSKEIITPNSI